jgi:diguanylate cyclase (GGDEF)-like protein
MMSPASGRAVRPAVRDPERISAQIRRFALVWLVGAAGVFIFVLVATMLASHYRDTAGRRARTATDAQLAVARLEASVERQAAALLSYRTTGNPAYRTLFVGEGYSLRTQLSQLRAATADGGNPANRSLFERTSRSLARWERAGAFELAQPHGGAGGLSRAGDPGPTGVVHAITARVERLQSSLTAESQAAVNQARSDAHVADMVQKAATLLGLIVLGIGGGRLLRRAFALAGEADARRERESGWSSQVEAVLAWSVKAKGAATRSQLIGFAHMAPRDAIGATCFSVSEGAAPAHPSHGQPRFVMEVDEAGEGLHVSVCFDHGRGDEHDHHALDLLLGHLAALWRTVLRQEDLERAAGHDALTGLPNRRAYEAELRRRVALSRRRGIGFTLAIVDLDHFKQVNDRFGHPEGDTVLRRAGEAVRSSLRTSDRVFRIGGEEFALILETGDEAGVADLLERTRESVKALDVQPAPDQRLSASIGWAVFPEDADERGDLIAQADAAVYRAKSDGRDRVVRAGRDAILS